jgi:hypothetical protein
MAKLLKLLGLLMLEYFKPFRKFLSQPAFTKLCENCPSNYSGATTCGDKWGESFEYCDNV